MKTVKTTFTAIALAGLSAPALANVPALSDFDDSTLTDDWRATAILGGDAVGTNGERIGSVHEMIIGDAGLIQSVVLTRNSDQSLDQDYLAVEWDRVTFRPDQSQARIDFTAEAASELDWQELPPIAAPGEWKVSRMIGMEVDSTDDVPEGEVEDVLFSQGANDMSAFVVESPLDETYYALPSDPQFVDYEENELDLPYTADAIEALPDLDY